MPNQSTAPEASPIPKVLDLKASDLSAVLRAGWSDFCKAPLFGIFFSAIYFFGGWVMLLIYTQVGEIWWAVPFWVGFPMIAPFAAVGLYEVSKQFEQSTHPTWKHILGVVIAERYRQIPSIGALIMFWFIVWIFVSHSVFAIIFGLSAMGSTPDFIGMLTTQNGLMLLAGELVIGAFFAFVVYMTTVMGLPLLLDREIDFITAMIISTKTVIENPTIMIIWAMIIAICLFAGMFLGFLGLFIALPVLGHATWHLYRRALSK